MVRGPTVSMSRLLAIALLGLFASMSLHCGTGGPRETGPGAAAGPALLDDGGIGAAPPDVGAVPEDAETSPSGLAWRVLVAGSGDGRPGVNDAVKVTYAGWKSDGTLFTQGDRQFAYVHRVIRGWTEALEHMAVGETRRLWVPPALAFVGAQDAPPGTVVFDLRLDEILAGPTPPADVAAPPPDAARLPDGLASKVVHAGTGTAHPGPDDGVRVRYSVWRTTGVLSDSSLDTVVVRPMGGDFAGWNEGLSQMVAGETRMLWIPPALGPGADGRGPASRHALTAVIELVEILSPPKAPPDVAKPRGATFARDGLAWRVLTPGTGRAHPGKSDGVVVRFTGWTKGGALVGSSVPAGEPVSVLVNGDLPGWSEVVRMMVEGETRRVWVPESLAYAGAPDRPAGALVFDIELVKIQPPAG